jgi:hypothetical protein
MADETYVPRTSADEDASHKLDAERTAFESSREHDSGTGSPQAKGETTASESDARTGDEPTGETSTPTGEY